MPFARKAAFAPSILALGLFTLLLFPLEARADAIVITGGSYSLSSPFFSPPPRYVSIAFNLHGTNFRATGGEGDGISRPVGSNCQFPCGAGSTFSLNSTASLFVERPTSLLQINGQDRYGWFDSQLVLNTDSVTIPTGAGSELTLTASFTMRGMISFAEYDLQNLVFTGFEFDSEVFGSGIVNITLAFSQIAREYEIRRVSYEFQPSAVPEPATLLLLGTGLAGLAARHRRRRVHK